MSDGAEGGPPLPEHPELREIALAMETARISGDLIDARWRTVFISSELARLNGVEPSEVGRFYGESMIVRHLDHPMIWGTDEKTALEWWRKIVPIMRHDLDPGDPDFGAIFSHNAEPAGRVAPVDVAPRAWYQRVTFPPDHAFTASVLSDLGFIEVRINDDAGDFVGVMRLVRTTLPESLLTRLGRGDQRLFERMDRVSEPGRRATAILFADLEASGVLSRRLSTRAYFDLVSGLPTDRLERPRAPGDRRQARR